MVKTPPPPALAQIEHLLRSFFHPTVLIELAALALCVGLAWLAVAALRRAFHHQDDSRPSILLGRKVVDGALFPIVLLGLGYVARALLREWISLAAFEIVIPVLIALVAIRVGVKVLQAAFPRSPWVRPMERTISWLAWFIIML